MPIVSQLTHSEINWPSMTSQMLTPGIVNDLPVAGMPMNSPWCVRLIVTRLTNLVYSGDLLVDSGGEVGECRT
jgi:hypothetical protein